MAGNKRIRAEKQTPTRRLNAQIREASLTRLMVHMAMTRRNPGDIISDLIDQHLRDYAIPATLVNRGKGKDRAIEASQAIESEQLAA